MGAQLVVKVFVFAVGKPLKPNEFRLFTHMALTALDTDVRPTYFGSREQSTLALGRTIPDPVPPDDPHFAVIDAERKAAFKRVLEAQKGLIDAGAIRRIRHGQAGQRAEFELTFGREPG